MGQMEMSVLQQTFKGKRVLVFGDTGFKGSWLSLWLPCLARKFAGLPCRQREIATMPS